MAYTNIDDPSAHFQTTLYTGNNTGGASNTITNDGNSDLQPDWVWIKSRSGTSNHNCSDSSRGATKHLAQNIAYQEEIVSGITAYNSDGFTVGSNNDANLNGATFVAWQWKANGGTTASNTDGNITSTVQANQDAGFSIGTYTGAGGTKTIGHGLNVAPEFFIIKRRDAAADWLVHPTFIDGTLDYLWLNLTNAALNAGEPLPTNSVFTVPDVAWANASGGTYVFYAFHSVQGYSKFGKYVGNGNANGPFIYTGFKPAFLLVKITTASGYDWRLVDSARNTFNLTDKLLMPNNNSAEFDGSTHASNMGFDFVSNGFKLRTTYTGMNGNTETFIYMAFAENPFTTSTGIPTTAR